MFAVSKKLLLHNKTEEKFLEMVAGESQGIKECGRKWNGFLAAVFIWDLKRQGREKLKRWKINLWTSLLCCM